MKEIAPLLIIPVAIGLTYLLLCVRASSCKKLMTKYLEEKGIDAEAHPCTIPPLRFWLRNRKGDYWAKLVHADGRVQYARYRGRLFSGDTIDLYD